MLKNDATYFDSFGIEHIPREIRNFIGNKNLQTNILRVQAYNPIMCRYFSTGSIDYMIMCRYFSTGSIDYMFTSKNLIDYTTLLSPHKFKKNYKITLSYFKDG